MSKPRKRRRSVSFRTEPDPIVPIDIDKLPAECVRAAIDVEPLLAGALGLPPDPYAWSDAQAQALSVGADRLAVEIHGLIEAQRRLRGIEIAQNF